MHLLYIYIYNITILLRCLHYRCFNHRSPRTKLKRTTVYGASRAFDTVTKHRVQHCIDDQSEFAYMDTVFNMDGYR